MLGWTHEDLSGLLKGDSWRMLDILFGWSLTIVAVSMGAPFWFDFLNKVMNVRNAGKKTEKSETQPQKRAEPAPGATEAKTL
jgi:hypothetical protein